MSFIDDSIKNIEKSVLKEKTSIETVNSFINDSIKNIINSVLKEETGTGAVGSFIGRGGQDIDDIFAGAFHPKYGELKDLLKKQVEDDFEKKLKNQEITPDAEYYFKTLDWDKYVFDDIYKHIENEEDFITDSETNMQNVGIDIKYDDNKPTYNKNDFINKSSTNWEYIGNMGENL